MKTGLTWLLALLSGASCGVLLLARFAHGAVTPAWTGSGVAIVLLGPPLALLAQVLSLRKPRQIGAGLLAAALIVVHVAVWEPIVRRMAASRTLVMGCGNCSHFHD